MSKIIGFIVNHFVAMFLVMIGLAAVFFGVSANVNINHDIKKYMPESSETAQVVKIMDDEFGDVDTTSYSVMLEDASVEELNEFSDFLESVEGVDSISHDETEDYNKVVDDKTYSLFTINVKGDADSKEAGEVYREVSKFLESKTYNNYENGDIAAANGAVVSPMVLILAVVATIVVITILSKSWIESWLYMVAIAVAIALNMGTNLMFPSVSHVTNAIAAILQLALSMDYSIMLANRYREEREKEGNKKKAMAAALEAGFSAISASSITTFVGLLALVFMSFTIGKDMGFVLAKGVLLSLLSIFTTLPALLLMFDKWIISSHKKALDLKMSGLAKFSFKARYLMIPVFIGILIAGFFLKGNVPINFTSSEDNEIKEVFEEENQVVVLYKNKDEKKFDALCHSYENNETVNKVLCYGNTIGEPEKVSELVAKADELGSDLTIEDYLLRTLYYHYYNLGETHRMDLATFVSFVKNDLADDPNFEDDISEEALSSAERLEYFVSKKVDTSRSLSELASILKIDEKELRELMVLYGNNHEDSKLGREVSGTKISLVEFVNFMKNTVMKNPTYAKKLPANLETKISLLETFTNTKLMRTEMPAENLAAVFGMDVETVGSVLQLTNLRKFLVGAGMTPAEVELLFNKTMMGVAQDPTKSFTEVMAGILMAEGKMQLVQALSAMSATAEPAMMTPADFIELLFSLSEDNLFGEKIQPSLPSLMQAKSLLSSAENSLVYNYRELANFLNLDAKSLRLMYSLYTVYEVKPKISLSLAELVSFMNNDVMSSADYSAKLTDAKKRSLNMVSSLIESYRAGETFDHKQMYSKLMEIAEATEEDANIDSVLVDLLYIYHGSVTEFNEDWTLSLEKFVEFLNEKVLTDERFERKISDDKRAQAVKAQADMRDAKKMLVGTEHSRMLLNTHLEAEGEETFKFLTDLKEDLDNSGISNLVAGNSYMAYEMSQTFDDEMNLITLITMAAIFVVVAITFKSLLIPAILVLIIQSAVWVTMSVLSFTGSELYFIAEIIVQAILMGATIDYAILFTSYYRDFKGSVKDALVTAYKGSINTILTSAAVLILVTFLVGQFGGATAIASKICITVSEGSLAATILVLLVLPGVLAGFGKLAKGKDKKK